MMHSTKVAIGVHLVCIYGRVKARINKAMEQDKSDVRFSENLSAFFFPGLPCLPTPPLYCSRGI